MRDKQKWCELPNREKRLICQYELGLPHHETFAILTGL